MKANATRTFSDLRQLQRQTLSEDQNIKLHNLLKERAILGATLQFSLDENYKLIDIMSVE